MMTTLCRRAATQVGAGLLLLFAGCSQADQQGGPTPPGPEVCPDRQVETWQQELIDLAWQGVCRFPLDPHIKNRSRAQEGLVRACLDLGLPRQAEKYAQRIKNWRRGSALAAIAIHSLERGHAGLVDEWLRQALALADGMARRAESQAWRRDRIRALVARARLLLGDREGAAALGQGLAASEAAELEVARAVALPASRFPEQCKAMEELVRNGELDQCRSVLTIALALLARDYGDPARRKELERLITTAGTRTPVDVQVDTLLHQARMVLDKGDPDQALSLIDAAARLHRQGKWLPQSEIALRARLARLLHRCGRSERARRELTALEEMYTARREAIVDIYRAGTLRPLAEAWAEVGDLDRARRLYRLAVSEGMGNPNSRPRAQDLAATCSSMACHGCRPDPALLARLAEISKGLDHPW